MLENWIVTSCHYELLVIVLPLRTVSWLVSNWIVTSCHIAQCRLRTTAEESRSQWVSQCGTSHTYFASDVSSIPYSPPLVPSFDCEGSSQERRASAYHESNSDSLVSTKVAFLCFKRIGQEKKLSWERLADS